jgi:branched-chain amino acid transport system substrate-binding protein
VNEQLTRREALVAALAAAALGGGALLRPVAARGATATATVGVILPLSHTIDSVAGNNILHTAQMWVDWINGHGGVDGQHIALKVYDDQNDPNIGAKSVVSAITKDHCSVILAGWDSRVVLAEIEEAHRLKTPFFVAYAWSADITKAGYPEVVRIGPNNDQLKNAFAPFLKHRGYRKVAVIAEDTPFGQGLGEAIRETATLAGIEVSAQVYKRDTHDLRPKLRPLLAGKPGAIVVAATVAPALDLAITQARALGYKGDILLGWDYVDDAFWKATDKHGTGVIWPTFSAPSLHLTGTGLSFKHLFVKRFKHAPLIYQALTWDQLNAWKWAVETAGSMDPAAVVPVLPRIDLPGTMGHITLSSTPDSVHYNQWDGITVYFDQAPKKGATDATAKVLASVKGSVVKTP